MRPAASVILFTTSAGMGYGLLFLVGLLAPLGLLPLNRAFALGACGLALGLITLGLLASTFHLGHPERAWRALSQWRSSWLSREGVAAVLTYLPAGLFALLWVVAGGSGPAWTALGFLAAAGAVLTVACTGMIYASLKPIRQWRHPLVVPVYLAMALASGALWLNLLLSIVGDTPLWSTMMVAHALFVAWLLKWFYWSSIDRQTPRSSAESATGLGHIGKVRLLDPPHTGENYLMKEMGFRIARKHGAKLRRMALLFGFVIPLLATALAGWLGHAGGVVAALLALVSGVLGIAVERWLFFAEAKHTVMLYYGESAA